MSTRLTIIVGITGGIAAYKAVGVVRGLVRAGHDVHVIPTEAALRFVGLPTLEATSRNPVTTSVWDDVSEVRHVALGRAADLVVIAPATADSIARMAGGHASDLLGTTLLATTAPVVIAPAMHPQMWEHPATVANIATLRSRGVHVVGPVVGALTGDDAGIGRMTEPDDIVAAALEVVGRGRRAAAASTSSVAGPRTLGDAQADGQKPGSSTESLTAQGAGGHEPVGAEARGTEALAPGTDHPDARRGDLSGNHVVVSAGGTREPLDPVRFIGNRSSGRQGVAIAAEAAARGAAVTLVAANVGADVLAPLLRTGGPAAPLTSAAGAAETTPALPVRIVAVGTARELADAVTTAAESADVVVMTAAVADFRPESVLGDKIKKETQGETMTMTLVRNPDVLAGLVERRRPGQLVVGFAAETEPDRERRLAIAREKLARKPADLLVVNHVGWDHGFERSENAIEVLVPGGDVVREAAGTKAEMAHVLLDLVATALT